MYELFSKKGVGQYFTPQDLHECAGGFEEKSAPSAQASGFRLKAAETHLPLAPND